MTTVERPLLRPRFLKWSIVVFAVLVPFATHAVSDFVAARRLKSAIDAIDAKREPVGLLDVRPYHVLSSEAAEAARYYSAAAALAAYDGATGSRDLFRRSRQVVAGLGRGPLSDDTLAALRAIVEDAGDPLRLMDHATPLVFEGFPAGTEFSYRYSQLSRLAQVAGMRTALMTVDGRENAGDSFYAEIRLLRAIEDAAPWPAFGVSSFAPGLTARASWVLSRTQPTARALSKLADAFAAIDRDDRLESQLLEQRARTIDWTFGAFLGPRYYIGAPTRFRTAGRVRGLLEGWLLRPWFAWQLRSRLDQFATAIDAAREPWPMRIDDVERVMPAAPKRELVSVLRLDLAPLSPPQIVARDVALIRCVRTAIAVERYRLDHAGAPAPVIANLVPDYLPTVPIDPFSGQPVKLVAEASGYKAYSVGANRRDDGGPFDGTELLGRDVWTRLDSVADFGIRIQRASR